MPSSKEETEKIEEEERVRAEARTKYTTPQIVTVKKRTSLLTWILGIIIGIPILIIIFSNIFSTCGQNSTPTPPSAQNENASTQKVLFNIPKLYGKTFSQLKQGLGKPSREGAPGIFKSSGSSWGFAEWDKGDFMLSITYDDRGNIVDSGEQTSPCGITILAQAKDYNASAVNQTGTQGYSETKVRQAGNLTGDSYPFKIIVDKDVNGNFYGLDICHE